MSDKNLLFLSESDIKSVISMKESIFLMRNAFRQISEGGVNTPTRTQIAIAKHDARALFMPAYSDENDLISLKLVTLFNNNAKMKLPLIHALVIVMDGTTGRPVAVIDGEYLTALRTGAASGLATDLLSRKDARILGIFGAGVQGKTQFAAVCEVREIDKVFIFDNNPDAADTLVKYGNNELNVVTELGTSRKQIGDCDIICTATSSPNPIFSDSEINVGVHINAIGAYQRDKREIPGETILRAKLVVDQRSACLIEAGDVIIPLQKKLIQENHIYAELGEIVTKEKTGRSDHTEITVFKSVGNAAQDLITADAIVRKAKEEGIGTTISL
jgi:ornithine cyclodeaminase/alanine dehydrogenase-like protein (mu-crystallin family)